MRTIVFAVASFNSTDRRLVAWASRNERYKPLQYQLAERGENP